MTPFVDEFGRWIFSGDPIAGLQQLSRSRQSVPVLDLCGISLSHFPKCIANISDLQDVYLDNNGLTKLSKNLGDISKLRLLSLGRNQLSTLPESLRNRWSTFEVLYLGDNQFLENPLDEEWMVMFKHGSIGSNSIPEPISSLWMTKSDVQEFPERISMLFLENVDQRTTALLANQAVELIRYCPEPMIYELLLKDVWIESTHDGTIVHWNDFLSQPKLKPLRTILLNTIPRGSLLHPSLLEYTVSKHLTS
jgi:Leucine-rich repeat (LRR) protein